ncbi:uncharacterized protein ACR2FA_003624 [Aphomia sociella]
MMVGPNNPRNSQLELKDHFEYLKFDATNNDTNDLFVETLHIDATLQTAFNDSVSANTTSYSNEICRLLSFNSISTIGIETVGMPVPYTGIRKLESKNLSPGTHYQKGKWMVLCLVALVAIAAAQYGHDHGHHAYSSQHISRHDGPAHPVSIHDHGHGHGHEHSHGYHHVDYYAHPKYDFEYKVSDPHTGDHKSQHESRDGDHVTGYYSLHEPDGSERHVDYHSDKHSGFHATVKHSTHHIVPYHHHHVIYFATLVAAAAAQFGFDHDHGHHGHGHAYSSQHISHYGGHHHGMGEHGHGHVHGHGHHGHGHGHHGHGHAYSSQHITHHGGHHHHGTEDHGHGHHDYHTHPKYEFDYKVSDPHTGDHKSQHETRDGDHVTGYYSLKQPDGSERTVHYHGDHHSGFHATVKYGTHHLVPHHHHHH